MLEWFGSDSLLQFIIERIIFMQIRKHFRRKIFRLQKFRKVDDFNFSACKIIVFYYLEVSRLFTKGLVSAWSVNARYH